jgi:hypothetical protein
MLAAYRATGADPPFGDPRGYHAVGMEGHFWRITQPRTGAVVVAIVAISRDAEGRPWAMASLAAHPGGAVRSATLPHVWAAPRGLALRCGDAFAADERSLRVDLGPDARLDATFAEPLPWPRRAFGALGPAHVVPGLSQYWHPWLLRARVSGTAHIGTEPIDLDGAVAYAEKNWGAGGMPPAWWWGQAHGFDRRRRRSWSPSATRCVPSCARCALCASASTSVAGAWPAPASRSRRTPTGSPRTCCRCRSRTSAGAWTTGRPSISRAPYA